MHGARNEQQFFVVRIAAPSHHISIGIFAEIAGMSLLPVDDEDCAADFTGILQNGLIEEGHAACASAPSLRSWNPG